MAKPGRGLAWGWALKRTHQCAKCPWLIRTNPYEIPNASPEASLSQKHVMACHEDRMAYCIGWLVNQMGPGNNIALRMTMRNCTNAHEIKLRGRQHERFENTLPKTPGRSRSKKAPARPS